jgi:hypothetical protein
MRKLLAAICILGLLGACGLRESRLNPFNWFGKGREERVAVQRGPLAETRPLVAEVLSLTVDRMPGGAIVNAMGLPPTQGHWDADLVPVLTGADGQPLPPQVMVFEFRLKPPPRPAPAGTQRSREVLVGTFLSDQKLERVREITVIGQLNRRTARR